MLRHQRGWVGMLLVLVALVIVAALAQTVLKHYGLLGAVAPSATVSRPSAGDVADSPAAVAAPSLQAPLERARGVEATVLKGAADQDRQLEQQTR